MTQHSDSKAPTGPEDPRERDDAPATAQDGETAGPARAPRGRGPALLALALALSAAAGAGWAAWQTWQLRDGRGDAGERVEALAQRLDRLGDSVQTLQGGDRESGDAARRAGEEAGRALQEARRAREAVGGVESRLETLGDRTDELAREIAALQSGRSELAARVDGLAARLEDRPDDAPLRDLALAQSEYLVRAAYRLLELEQDPARAARAMALAAEGLEGLSAPGLTRAREAVARELEAIRAVEPVDRAGLAARLAALADRAGSLPLRDQWDAGRLEAPERDAGSGEAGGRGWWQATRDFMGEYFTVRRTDEAGTTLPDPDTLGLTRELLRLELEQARLALLRREPALYRQSLDRAASLVDRYFAADAPAVRSARDSLSELREAEILPALPEHGAALEALAGLRARDAGAP